MAMQRQDVAQSTIAQPVLVTDQTPKFASPAYWRLDPSITFLNHGSYGAVPQPVADVQREFQDRMDKDPVRFFMVDLERYLDQARDAIADLVVCDPRDLVLVPNGTFAVASILQNLDTCPGDEVLITDHEYMAGQNELVRLARQRGLVVKVAKVPLPITGAEEITRGVLDAITPKTRLVVLSHLTSASALITPVAEVCRELNERGIDSLIDGAHAPGQVPINLEALAPTFYAASLHKWAGTPRGTGFVHVRRDRQDQFQPAVLSSRVHKQRTRPAYLCDFDYVGTADYSPLCAIPFGLQHLGSLMPGGMAELQDRNHELVCRGRTIVQAAINGATGIDVPLPAPESMIGSMATVFLPSIPPFGPDDVRYDDPLQDRLVEQHAIQVPIWDLPATGHRMIRLSAQLYNSIEDFEHLAAALSDELRAETR